MQQLFDRYMIEVAPKKAPNTYEINKRQIKNLSEVFGMMPPDTVTPVHIYQYLDNRGKKSPIAANREKALLSHIFSMAIRWGVVRDNPCRGVKRNPEKRRDRYITDVELWRICKYAPKHISNIVRFAYLTGLRQGDILKIKHADITSKGIFSKNAKTGNKMIIEWSPRLQAIVRQASKINSQYKSEFIFLNSRGKPYTSSGF